MVTSPEKLLLVHWSEASDSPKPRSVLPALSLSSQWSQDLHCFPGHNNPAHRRCPIQFLQNQSADHYWKVRFPAQVPTDVVKTDCAEIRRWCSDVPGWSVGSRKAPPGAVPGISMGNKPDLPRIHHGIHRQFSGCKTGLAGYSVHWWWFQIKEYQKKNKVN